MTTANLLVKSCKQADKLYNGKDLMNVHGFGSCYHNVKVIVSMDCNKSKIKYSV
jgi:hypothetical protein